MPDDRELHEHEWRREIERRLASLQLSPEQEADLLSYLLFDRSFTEPLVELGRADAKAREDELLRLLTDG